MSRREFRQWIAFFRQFPFDDLHRYHRPAALTAFRAGGGEIEQLLQWLQPEPDTGFNVAERNSMKAFGLKPPPRKG